MKVTELEATNVKGLSHIHIRPEGAATVLVTGRNGQGKSSTLESLFLALGGRKAMAEVPKPVRDGEDTAEVRIVLAEDGADTDELVVTRKWTAGGDNTSLKVTRNGFRAEKGQTALDGLVGNMSFDPLAWLREPPAAQRATLLGVIDLPFDLDEIDRERQELFDERTVVNREVATMEHRVSGMIEPPDGTPGAEQSMHELIAEMDAARELDASIDSLHHEVELAASDSNDADLRVTQLRQQLEEAEAEAVAAEERWDTARQAVELAPARPDIDAIRSKLGSIEQVNADVRAKQARQNALAELTAKTAEATNLTDEIAKIDRRKKDALREADMPVDGLSVDEKTVLFGGQPLKQCSTSEQIKVSVAVAMASDPKIKVIRIVDGNDLDESNLQLIMDLAEQNSYQVWVERVGEAPDGRSFHIEAGEIVAEPNKEGNNV